MSPTDASMVPATILPAAPPPAAECQDGEAAEAHLQGSGPSMVSVSIVDPQILQRCYLPFFRNGGLFIPGSQPYQLRQRLFLVLKLPAADSSNGNTTTHALTATVAWVTPAQAQGGRGMGVGLHFDGEPAGGVKTSIESLLAALL